MEASSTASTLPHPIELPAWKTTVSHVLAIAVGAFFLLAGVYKALSPYQFVTLATALLVPEMQWLASSLVPVTLVLSIFEITAGALLLVPQYRRWGALIAGAMLVGFLAYFGVFYEQLKGLDCSCFPAIQLPFGMTLDLQREVGPEFFYSELVGLAAVALAGFWAKPASALKVPLMIFGTVVVFSSVAVGADYAARNSGVKAPEFIEVEGQQYSLWDGNKFLFFYDPACPHCEAASKSLSTLTFKDGIDVIAIPTDHPEWVEDYMSNSATGTNLGAVAKTSLDEDKLREVFVFEFPPYGIYLEDGVQQGIVPHFEDGGTEHVDWLRANGIIE